MCTCTSFQSNLTQDTEVQVRVSYAENIALLAETALRFLEIVQLSTTSEAGSAEEAQIEAQYKVGNGKKMQCNIILRSTILRILR